MSLNPKFIYIFLVSFSFVAAQENIEEIVVTGTLIKDAESDLSPVQIITAKDYENLNNDYKKKVKGEVFFAASMAYLLDGRTGSFEGPISQMWLDAWRMSFTSKLNPNASIEEIRTLAQSYNIEQLPGVDNLVQSKFLMHIFLNYLLCFE